MTWLDDTRKLIKESNMSYAELGKIAGCSTRWVYRFMDKDDYNDVGVLKTQRMHDALVARKAVSDAQHEAEDVGGTDDGW